MNTQSANKSISTVEVFQGSQNLYYKYAGVNYDYRFPLEFALNHEMIYGGLCESCMTDGFMNGVFIGYCVKCIDELFGLSANRYKGRGNGMLPGCIERKGWMSGSYYDPANSIWATYMKPTICTRDGIGCESLCEKMTYMPEHDQDQDQEQDSCCDDSDSTIDDNDSDAIQPQQQEEVCCSITVDSCDDSDGQEYDSHDQEYGYQDHGKRMLIQELDCECETQTITSLNIASLNIASLERAIEIGQVAVRDRIKHTAMYCGNN